MARSLQPWPAQRLGARSARTRSPIMATRAVAVAAIAHRSPEIVGTANRVGARRQNIGAKYSSGAESAHNGHFLQLKEHDIMIIA